MENDRVVYGVDILDTEIRYVALEHPPATLQIREWGTQPLLPGSMIGNRIQDIEGVGACLHTLFRKTPRLPPVWIAVPFAHVSVQHVPEAHTRKEALQQAPPRTTSYADAHPCDRGWQIWSIPKRPVDRRLAALHAAGIRAAGVNIDAYARARAFETLWGAPLCGRILWLGSSHYTVLDWTTQSLEIQEGRWEAPDPVSGAQLLAHHCADAPAVWIGGVLPRTAAICTHLQTICGSRLQPLPDHFWQQWDTLWPPQDRGPRTREPDALAFLSAVGLSLAGASHAAAA